MLIDRAKKFIKEKVARPVLDLLKKGVSPEQLALAFSVGIVVGVIPLLGSTTLICTLLAYFFRLNFPALQLVNYLMFPFQLLFFIPFFQAGGYFFEPLDIPASVTQIREMMSLDFSGTLRLFWRANLQALGVWLLLAIPSFYVLNFIFQRSFRRISLAFMKKRSS